jgi:hypothetical protein
MIVSTTTPRRIRLHQKKLFDTPGRNRIWRSAFTPQRSLVRTQASSTYKTLCFAVETLNKAEPF